MSGTGYAPGDVAVTRCGSDAGTTYLVLQVCGPRLLLWDGRRHRIAHWKSKNRKHCTRLAPATPATRALAEAATRVQAGTDAAFQLDARLRNILKDRIKKGEYHVQRGCH